MIGLLFAGQGAEAARMGLDIAAAYPRAGALLAQASAEVDLDLTRLLERGGPALRQTRVLQPLMTAICLGTLEALRQEAPEMKGAAVAGHSLGELAAWSAAGGPTPQEAVTLAARRGALMQRCVDALDATGGMLALPAIESPERLDEILERARVLAGAEQDQVAVAAHNAPGRWVISGPASTLRQLQAHHGGSLLSVSGPWHSAAMEPAVEPLRALTSRLAGASPLRAAFISNRDGEVTRDSRRVADLLAEQLVRPVSWVRAMEALAALGATRLVAVGPGRTLRHLTRQQPALSHLEVWTTDHRRALLQTARRTETP